MEYIHKAKAEKARTKVLNDQMEARRTKNKVPRFQIPRDRKADSFSPFRPLGNDVHRGLPRRGRHSLRKMHPRRSDHPSYDLLPCPRYCCTLCITRSPSTSAPAHLSPLRSLDFNSGDVTKTIIVSPLLSVFPTLGLN